MHRVDIAAKTDAHYRQSVIFFLFFFFRFFIYLRGPGTQPRGEVAQRGMKARHQFKKSTPLVVAGKNAAPPGGGRPLRNPC